MGKSAAVVVLVEVTKELPRPGRAGSLLSQLTPQDLEKLLSLSDYRGFLRYFLKPHSPLKQPLSYAEFSRRAGFASRAFPRDVCNGNRSINADTLPKFMRALGLTGDWKEYFISLVLSESEQSSTSESAKLSQKLDRLKNRLQKGNGRSSKVRDTSFADRVFAIPELPRIFSALGPINQGSPLKEIARRLKLPEELLSKRLEQMQKLGLVVFNESTCTFHGQSSHQVVTDVGSSEFFKHFFLRSVQNVQTQASKSFKSESKLFLQTSVSVSSTEKVRQLKKELRELIFKFAEDNEDPSGEVVIDLTVAMFDPSESL
jgi:uncharacterized protein (TIGR02147 family)